jgi:glucosamine-6-phosphate deaminase
MEIHIHNSREESGKTAANEAISLLRDLLSKQEFATIILATGASQFELLKTLAATSEIDWSRVIMFHLDEYIHLPETHPASFRKYLKERFINLVPALKDVHLINGEFEPADKECARLNSIITKHTVDLAFVGIGENGHLAFNDPPADFQTEQPYIIVELDNECRKQQLGEGWFKSFEEVPRRAISMSVKQIMKSRQIICCVPDKRKAKAVKNCLEHEVSNLYPSSILRLHPGCSIYLDWDSSSLLSEDILERALR